MFSYKMEQRNPIVWNVTFGDKIGQVFRNIDKPTPRSKRWCLVDLTEFQGQDVENPVEVPILYFKSRRAAFHFFKTGEKFKTKPVYAGMRGGGSKRIR